MSTESDRNPIFDMAAFNAENFSVSDYTDAIERFTEMGVSGIISNGMTPFHAAAIVNNPKYLRALVQMDEDGSACDIKDNGGRTALSYACENGNTEIVRILMTKACDLVTPDNFNATPLKYACSKGHTEIVSLLLEAGVPVDS
jgi:ankyrin repeat protein